MSDVQRCRACAIDVTNSKGKKQRRTLSRNAPFCVVLTPIAAIVREDVDVKKFEEGYICKNCSRELEKIQRLEAQLNEAKKSMLETQLILYLLSSHPQPLIIRLRAYSLLRYVQSARNV